MPPYRAFDEEATGMNTTMEPGGYSSEAEVLGLEPGETAPVRIILAAQLRLRGFRRGGGSQCSNGEVQRIIEARDALLQRAVGTLANRGANMAGENGCNQNRGRVAKRHFNGFAQSDG
jgi:hypothetical protein